MPQSFLKVSKAARKKTKDEQFDHLFAVTYVAFRYDHWHNDTDIPEEVRSSLKTLGNAWKKVPYHYFFLWSLSF